MSYQQKDATSFLRQHGYTWSGRPQKEVIPEQIRFENRIKSVPMYGRSSRKPPRTMRAQ